MKPKIGIAAVLSRKKRGYPKTIICDTLDQGEVEMIMAALDLGYYRLEYRYFTPKDVTVEPEEK